MNSNSLNPSSTPPSAAMEPRTYTERERQEARRHAFLMGVREAVEHGKWERTPDYSLMEKVAEERFPLPKVQRPRVVQFNDTEWCIVAGSLLFRPWFRGRHHEWSPWASFRTDPRTAPSKDLVALWADLFQNPNELVDADGAET